jgi:excisionase family DNA binding protein
MMDIDDVAEYLRLSRSSVYKMVGAGELPGHKVGKHWRFRKSTIDAWLDDRGNAEASALLRREPEGGQVQPSPEPQGIGARSLGQGIATPASRTDSDLEGALSARQIALLAERWIVNAQQFIALAAQPSGRDGISHLLGLEPENIAEIARSLDARLGDERKR